MAGRSLCVSLLTLFLILLGFSHSVSAEDTPPLKVHFSGCTNEKTVFFAWAENHKNAVEICQVKGGYRYSYGNIAQPEVRVVVKEIQVFKMYWGMKPAFVIMHNNISYWLSADKYGEASLMVTQGDWLKGTALDSVVLETDGMGYTNRIEQMLPLLPLK